MILTMNADWIRVGRNDTLVSLNAQQGVRSITKNNMDRVEQMLLFATAARTFCAVLGSLF